jgi:hypothetical protein
MTYRRPGTVGTALLLLAAVAVRAEDEAPAADAVPAPSWYAQALARGPRGINVTHFWSRGAAMRAETVVAGHRIVTIVKGEYYYAYDAIAKNGVQIRRTPAALAADSPTRRPFGNELELLIGQGAEKIRDDSLFGRECEVYRVTDQRGRRELWVTKDELNLPLRIEIYDRSRARTRYTDYLNWLSDLPVRDSFFEPETGVELESFEIDDYLKRTVKEGPIGPVPILYGDLLHGKR